jgi:hypothetical protein
MDTYPELSSNLEPCARDVNMLHASQTTMHGHHLQIRDQWINTVEAHLVVLSALAFLVLECCRKSLMTRPKLNTHWYEQGAKGKEKKRFK